MFEINQKENSISKLETRKFSDLKIRERPHLQEWIAKNPTALGEELLIIQKEFDGFSETKERLDLLALDKSGQLVIIENKLDDSGRDVTWQAIKYAAYCSTLTKSQIIDIYQMYLGVEVKAQDMICSFLEVDDLSDQLLNEGTSQRIIFIAANFRKEVTATALWLLSQKIPIQCFKVTPFSHQDQLFLDIQQIIPTPEAEDLMISMANKEQEEKSTKLVQRSSHQLRFEFWQEALEQLRAKGLSRYETVNPTRDHWLSCGTGMSGVVFSLIFSKVEARVEVSIQRSDALENKMIYDELHTQKYELETSFGQDLRWLRLDDIKRCRVFCTKEFDGYSKENWPEMIDWLCDHMLKLQEVFEPAIADINKAFKIDLTSS